MEIKSIRQFSISFLKVFYLPPSLSPCLHHTYKHALTHTLWHKCTSTHTHSQYMLEYPHAHPPTRTHTHTHTHLHTLKPTLQSLSPCLTSVYLSPAWLSDLICVAFVFSSKGTSSFFKGGGGSLRQIVFLPSKSIFKRSSATLWMAF